MTCHTRLPRMNRIRLEEKEFYFIIINFNKFCLYFLYNDFTCDEINFRPFVSDYKYERIDVQLKSQNFVKIHAFQTGVMYKRVRNNI